jgi:phosphatidylserine/phosphatidylglycerophosphate/cardiolipin synthase-like enzyme
MSKISDALVEVARELSSTHSKMLSTTYSRLGEYSSEAASKALNSLPAPHRPLVVKVNSLWEMNPELPGLALSTSIDAARRAFRLADEMKSTLVVTGPESTGTPVRLTSQVVVDLIDRAKERILIVSFAAYRIAAVIEALDKAVNRGVVVDLILESPENLIGGGGSGAYSRFRVYSWPIAERSPVTAKLHAKAIVVDGERALLTSANLTNAAFDANVEIGILCEGGTFASQIQGHFLGLIRTRVFRIAES